MVPLGAGLRNPPGSIGGRQPANTAMRAHMVVVVSPEPQHRAGMAERHEQRLVEAFVAQTTVEALDVAVLLRLARRDVVPLDRSLLRPSQDRQAGQLGAVVADHRMRLPPDAHQAGQFPRHPSTRQRRIGHQRQALASVVIDYAQDTEAPAADQAVGDEVERPTLVRTTGQHHWPARAQRPLAPATATHAQSFLAVDAQQLLVVGCDALPRQQIAQAAITEPATFRRQFAQPLPQRPVIGPCRLVTDHSAAHTNQCTRPTLAHPVMLPGMGDGLPLSAGRYH